MAELFNFHHFGLQIVAVLAAFICCLLLGVERNFHQKDAGVKTHVLVGVGSCIFTLVSAYGFSHLASNIDPSRVAAQIVSGIGFLGAGVIFVNNDTVRGLTTAATIWVSAAIGMACGAGMIPLAVAVLVLHYLLVFAVGPLVSKFHMGNKHTRTVIEYRIGFGVMRHIVTTASSQGFKTAVTSTQAIQLEEGEGMRVVMKFDGRASYNKLLESLSSISGVYAVETVESNTLD